jgi:hypothetical protein
LHLFTLAKRRIPDALDWIYGQYEAFMGGLAQEILLFSMLAVAIVRFQNQSAVALTLLLAIEFVGLALWNDRYDRWSFFIVALFGTCAEVFFVRRRLALCKSGRSWDPRVVPCGICRQR